MRLGFEMSEGSGLGRVHFSRPIAGNIHARLQEKLRDVVLGRDCVKTSTSTGRNGIMTTRRINIDKNGSAKETDST